MDALAIFNRLCQPDFDIDRLEIYLSPELIAPLKVRFSLAWITMLHGRLRASLAAARGVYGATGIIKYVMVGTDCYWQTASDLNGHLADSYSAALPLS